MIKSHLTNPSLDEEELGDLIVLAWRLIFGDQKLRKKVKDEEKLRFLLVDLRFYSNYFFTLAKHSWWGISPHQLHLHLLDDKVEKNEQMQHDLSNSIQEYLHPNSNRVSVLDMLVWKKQLIQNYSILMNVKPRSLGYISRRNMVQFITNLSFIAFDLLRCRDDLDADEKQAIRASLANLNFLRAFVQLAESEGMGSLLNCIQDYTCKVEVLLFRFWTRKTRGRISDSLVSALMQRIVNVDDPCSILIILEVFKMSSSMFHGEGMSWRYQDPGAEVSHNYIWESTQGFIPYIITDRFINHISHYISKVSFGFQLLQEHLTFLASYVDDLSLDMRVVFVRAATSLRFIDTFSFLDLSEQVVIEQVKFHLSVLTTSLQISKAEVLLGKLLSHDSSLVIFMMSLAKELQDSLEFLRKCLTDMEYGYLENKGQLISQIEAVSCDTLSFLKLLGEHEMEEDACTEIDLSFLKLLGTTKLIQAHVLALQLLNRHKEFQLEDQLVKLCDKLGFLVELVKNLDENNVNQVMFLLDTGATETEVASIISLFGMDMTEERLKEGNLRLLHLTADIELLEAELMLNSFLNHDVDLIVPFSNIETLRNRFRLLRIVLTDSIERDSGDKELVVSGDKLVKYAIPLVSKLFHNRSNKGMAMEMNDLVSDLFQNMNAWETNVTARYLRIRRSSLSTHPRTNGVGFIDCLVDSLSNLSSSMPAFPWMKYHIGRAFKGLKSSKSLLKDIAWEHNVGDELNNLVSQLTRVAYEVEYVAEAFVIGYSNTWSKRLWITDLIDEIKQISVKISDVFAKQSYKDGDNPLGTSAGVARVLLPVDTSLSIEVVAGMKEQEEKVINQLTRGSTKLGIVSIVGMGGLGKTTLAKTVFNAPLVQNSFDVRAWCCISKLYQKREILLDLLGHVTEVTPEIQKMTDDDLSNRLRQLLLERTYLIVMDDIWDVGAWKELQQSFPKDEKGSRIILTSRNNDIASKTGYGFEPCSLDLLSDRESWELLERKLFEEGSCPLQFREVGWEIAMNCKGLPLAVVVISGLLSAKEMNLDWWKQVAGNLNSIVVGNSKTFTNIIDLSYRYLPDYLKPCFLYFAAFQEDKKILVTNLIDLWTTEGFIRRKDDKNLNDVARDYLLELVSRNLVNVAERTSMGGIKACHVHDLLHELCWARAEEENFLHVVKDMGNYSSFSVSNALEYGPGSHLEASVKYEHRCVCIYSDRRNFVESKPSGQCVRSLLLFATGSRDGYVLTDYDASFISLNFKFLRTLKLDSINIGDFLPDGFEVLIQLRFLAVLGTMKSIPDSIECLSNLEIFYVKGLRGEISLPHSIWTLKKLRNLRVKDRLAFTSMDKLAQLDNLESLSSVFLPSDEESTQYVLQGLSRLKKLKCIFSESWSNTKNCNWFPILNSLVQLESLKILYHGKVRHPSVFSYPSTLKKLSLSKFRLPWKEISTIGSLPCLEVLKLMFKAFEGEDWEVGSEEFLNLKYLKMDSLDIVRWTTSYDSFPSLQQLVLQSCKQLEEVPFAFGESSTLQMIQVQWCSKSVAKSVKDIHDEQMETSGRQLNVLVHPPEY